MRVVWTGSLPERDVGGTRLLPSLGVATVALAVLWALPVEASAAPLFSKLSGEMAEARYMPAGAILPSGDVLIAAGYNPTNKYLKSAEVFEPATGKFKALSVQMTAERDEPISKSLPDGHVLIAGGTTEAGGKYRVQQSAELFDPGGRHI